MYLKLYQKFVHLSHLMTSDLRSVLQLFVCCTDYSSSLFPFYVQRKKMVAVELHAMVYP